MKKCILWKILAIGLSKYAKIKVLSPLSFPEKYDYLMRYLDYFWQETGRGHKSKDQNQSLTYPISPTRFLVNFL